jgi:hypothetical protein
VDSSIRQGIGELGVVTVDGVQDLGGRLAAKCGRYELPVGAVEFRQAWSIRELSVDPFIIRSQGNSMTAAVLALKRPQEELSPGPGWPLWWQ